MRCRIRLRSVQRRPLADSPLGAPRDRDVNSRGLGAVLAMLARSVARGPITPVVIYTLRIPARQRAVRAEYTREKIPDDAVAVPLETTREA